MKITPLMIFSLIVVGTVILIIPASVRADVELEYNYLDSIGDVELITSEGDYIHASGHTNIDIVSAESSSKTEAFIEKVVLEMTVKGSIVDSEDVKYIFMISADEEDYLIIYNNGECIGTKMETSKPIPVEADVEDSTLTVEIRLKNLGDPTSSFVWSAVGLEIKDDERYVDLAPNKIVRIANPSDGATVYNTITINGIIRESTRNIQYVEIKIDDGNWERTTSIDSGTWSYEWDTESVSDGIHYIYVKGNDRSEYEDSIVVYVDQNCVTNPETLDNLPLINVGDSYDYVSVGNPEVVCINVAMAGDRESGVKASEAINVGGTSYNVLRYEIHEEGEMLIGGFTVTHTADRIQWLKSSDRTLVKEDITTVISGDLVETTTIHTIKTYNPPTDNYNFPIKVGGKWSATTTISADTNTTTGGETTSSTSTKQVITHFECLHIENVDTESGTYETFVVKSQQEGSNMHTLEYYNSQHSFPVKIEKYNLDRNLLAGLGLKQWEKGTGSNIVIAGIMVDPAEPETGETVEIAVDVKNTGNNNISDAIIEIKVNNIQIDQKTVFLDVGETKKIKFYWTPEHYGDYTITVTTTNDQQIKNVVVSKTTVGGNGGGFIPDFTAVSVLAVFTLLFLIKRKKQKH